MSIKFTYSAAVVVLCTLLKPSQATADAFLTFKNIDPEDGKKEVSIYLRHSLGFPTVGATSPVLIDSWLGRAPSPAVKKMEFVVYPSPVSLDGNTRVNADLLRTVTGDDYDLGFRAVDLNQAFTGGKRLTQCYLSLTIPAPVQHSTPAGTQNITILGRNRSGYLGQCATIDNDQSNKDFSKLDAMGNPYVFRRTHFLKADVSDSNLEGLDLTDADFTKAEGKNVRLVQATARELTIDRSNFSQANLSRAQIGNLFVKNSNLSRATFTDASITYLQVDDSLLESADFSHAKLGRPTFKNTGLKNVTFDSAQLNSSSFEDVVFEGSNFNNTRMLGLNFKKVKLGNTRFKSMPVPAKLKGWAEYQGKFEETDFQKSDWSDGILQFEVRKSVLSGNFDRATFWPDSYGSGFKDSKLNGSFRGTSLSYTLFLRSSLESPEPTPGVPEASFTGASLQNVSFCHADLSKANLDGANLKGARLIDENKLPFSNEEARKRGMVFCKTTYTVGGNRPKTGIRIDCDGPTDWGNGQEEQSYLINNDQSAGPADCQTFFEGK